MKSPSYMLELQKAQRQNPTPAEEILWRVLRGWEVPKPEGAALRARVSRECGFCSRKLVRQNPIAYHKSMTLLIDQNGKLEIPESLRAALHLEPGSEVQIEQKGETLVLSAAKPEPYLKRVGRILMWTGEVGPEMNDAVERMREDRAREVSDF